ncbi:hypothetical protein RQP46_006760 [Phenoliferia psychrophenolica]
MFSTTRLARSAALKSRSFTSSSRAASETLAVIPFAFNATNLSFCNEIISRYPAQYKKAAMIPLLEIAQKQNKGWTSLSAMNEVARILEVPPMRVYEVASEPVGDFFVQICTTTPCMLGGCGSDSIVDTITKHLGVGLGQTTKDNKFTLLEVECLGACSNAPMVQINDKFYEDLTPESTISILDALAAGKSPKTGPQSARQSSEPMGKLTALFEESRCGSLPSSPPLATVHRTFSTSGGKKLTMFIPKLKVKPRRQPHIQPCALELTAMLGCWASFSDLSNNGACKESAKALHLCMTKPGAKGKARVSTVNYALAKF